VVYLHIFNYFIQDNFWHFIWYRFWHSTWYIFGRYSDKYFFKYFGLVCFDKYLRYFLKLIWKIFLFFRNNIFEYFIWHFYMELDLGYLLALHLECLISIWHIFCYITRQNLLDFILCIFPCSFWYSVWCIVENSWGVQQCALGWEACRLRSSDGYQVKVQLSALGIRIGGGPRVWSSSPYSTSK